MTLQEFQTFINDRWPHQADGDWTLPAFGLAGEAGETVDEFKKIWRYCQYGYTGLTSCEPFTLETRRQAIALELGDALHYIARLSSVAGLTLEEIAYMNLAKTAPNVKSPENRSRL